MLKKKTKQLLTAFAISSALVSVGQAAGTDLEKGKKLAFDRSKGNCLACHMMDNGNLAGTIAPPLLAMKARYPDKQKLYDKIWGIDNYDEKWNTPAQLRDINSMMPPFGRNGSLSEEEVNLIVDYVYSL